MKRLKKTLLAGLTILILAPNALAQTADYVGAWRITAKKNFLEGFCVGQTLAGQQVTIQSGQQIDQVTANTIKAAITTCKAKNKASTTQTTAP